MQQIPTQTDGKTSLAAASFNQIPLELETLITSSGQVLDGNFTNQASRAIIDLGMNAGFYTDSGTANNIVLSNSNNPDPTSLRDGIEITFKAAATNTGATTLNLAGLGAKSCIDYYGSSLISGFIISGEYYKALYQASSDNFIVYRSATPYIVDKSSEQRLFYKSNNTVGYRTETNPLTLNSSAHFTYDLGSFPNDFANIKSEKDGQAIFNIWQTGTSVFGAVNFYKGNVQTLVGSISCSTTGTTYNVTSDYRLKENFKDYENGLTVINNIKVKEYNFKVEKTKKVVGVIAHELQSILPNSVTGEKDAVDSNGNILPQGVDFSTVVPYLIQAVQDLTKQVNELKDQLKNI